VAKKKASPTKRTRKEEELFRARSRAAKKGAKTRKANAQALAREAKKHAKERKEAALKGWETRRAKAERFAKETAYEEKAIVREALRAKQFRSGMGRIRVPTAREGFKNVGDRRLERLARHITELSELGLISSDALLAVRSEQERRVVETRELLKLHKGRKPIEELSPAYRKRVERAIRAGKSRAWARGHAGELRQVGFSLEREAAEVVFWKRDEIRARVVRDLAEVLGSKRAAYQYLLDLEKLSHEAVTRIFSP
jgi:hypothetical protein